MTEQHASGAVRVRLDRRRLNRVWFPVLAMNVVFLVVIVGAYFWAVSLDSVSVGLASPLLLIAAFELMQLSLVWGIYSGMRQIPVPLELDPDGLLVRSPYGEVLAPWSAVTSVSIERHLMGRRLRVRLAPEGDPAAAGIVSGLKGRAGRVLRREGMRYSCRILDVDQARLRQLFAEQSGGTVVVR